MKTTLFTLSLFLISLTAYASEPAKVMLFGTFHFKDAGKDLVKMEDINVFDDASQAYIEVLTSRLAEFNPTKVLLEYNPDNEEAINTKFSEYLAGNFELPANEIYQLGFRIAKKSGLKRVHSFDHREIPWQADAMFEYAKTNESPEMASFQQLIGEYMEDEKQVRATSTLQDMLARSNDPQMEELNMASYLLTNSIGSDDGFSGADSTASWWHRNFRMYARLQKHAAAGEKVIALAGSGHTAILKQLLSIDRQRQSVDVLTYINEGPGHGQ